MTDLFEQRLARALSREAARAPLTRREWTPVEAPAGRPSAPRLTRYTAAAAAVGLVVGTGVTLLAVGDNDDDTIRSITTAPDGIEVPMVPAPSDTPVVSPGGAVKPGSVYAFTVDDVTASVNESMWWTGIVSDPVQTQICVLPDRGGGMCGSADEEAWTTDVTTGSGPRMVYVAALPEDTAYVSVAAGAEIFWQDPLRDLAVLPIDASATTYEVSVVLRDGDTIDLTTQDNGGTTAPTDSTDRDQYPADVNDEVRLLVAATGQACLEEAGLSDPLAHVPEGVDVDGVWDGCIARVNDAVADRQLEDLIARQILANELSASSTAPAG